MDPEEEIDIEEFEDLSERMEKQFEKEQKDLEKFKKKQEDDLSRNERIKELEKEEEEEIEIQKELKRLQDLNKKRNEEFEKNRKLIEKNLQLGVTPESIKKKPVTVPEPPKAPPSTPSKKKEPPKAPPTPPSQPSTSSKKKEKKKGRTITIETGLPDFEFLEAIDTLERGLKEIMVRGIPHRELSVKVDKFKNTKNIDVKRQGTNSKEFKSIMIDIGAAFRGGVVNKTKKDLTQASERKTEKSFVKGIGQEILDLTDLLRKRRVVTTGPLVGPVKRKVKRKKKKGLTSAQKIKKLEKALLRTKAKLDDCSELRKKALKKK